MSTVRDEIIQLETKILHEQQLIDHLQSTITHLVNKMQTHAITAILYSQKIKELQGAKDE